MEQLPSFITIAVTSVLLTSPSLSLAAGKPAHTESAYDTHPIETRFVVQASSSTSAQGSVAKQPNTSETNGGESRNVKERPHTGVTYEAKKNNAGVECSDEWWDFLPILGRDACEAGYVLPRPFGISVITLFQNQPFNVNSIDVNGSLFGGDIPDINPYVKAADVKVSEATVTFRFDAWIFPFLNLYGFGGRSDGNAEGVLNINGSFDDPAPFPFPSCFNALPSLNDQCFINANGIPFNINFKSNNYGGGLTLAGGVGDFFAMVDGNYTISDIDISTDDAKTTVISSRVGWNGAIGFFVGSIWVGGMYQDINQVLNIPIGVKIPNPAPIGPGDIADIQSVRIDQSAADKYNWLFGGRWAFTKHVELLAETNIGFKSRKQFLMQLSYRF